MPTTLSLLLPPMAAFAGTAAILALLLFSGWGARLALDRPNERSLHSAPTPRIGGLAMLPSVLVAWLLFPDADGVLIGLAVVLLLLSFADDRHSLPISLRLLVHLAVALVFIFFHTSVRNPWLIAVFAVTIAWLINLYNFMDGADGLAGGMALFGFGSYGLAAMAGGSWSLATTCFCVAAASTGFLLFNFPPARVFMGDAGAIPLGFLAGVLGLDGWNHGSWHWWFPVLVFSPFVLDATVTLIRRVLRRERFWQAHQEHYYQRVIRLGATHGQLARWQYALMAAAATLAMLGNGRPAAEQPLAIQYAVVISWAIFCVFLMVMVDRRWRNRLAQTDSGQ